jgi:hypothetical protein
MRSLPGLALGAATLLLWLPGGVARADTYCVSPATGCDGAHTLSTVQSALSAAAGNPGADTIQLGAATYTQDNMAYTGSDPVSIVGAGTTNTTLRRATAAAGSYVLRGTGTGPLSVSHLHVHLLFFSASSVTGLRLDSGGNLDDLSIDADAGSYNPQGVSLTTGTSALTGSTIDLPSGGECVYSGGSPTITGDVLKHCSIGLNSQHGTALAQRLRIIDTGIGVDVGGGTTTVEDSLITFSSGATGLTASGSSPAVLNANQVTVVGSGTGVGVKAFNHVTTNVTVNLARTIIRGFTNSLVRDATASHPANIVADYNDYATATVSEPGAGPGSITSTHVYNDVDPEFVNAAAGDYHLAAGSPLIDQDPAPLAAGESPFDFDGNARIVGGARDLGAFEHIVAPTATTGAVTAVTSTSATISGAVNPGGGAASWQVLYGPTSGFGMSSAGATLGPSAADQPVSLQLTGLTPGTTYHYEITATSSAGTGTGADLTFTTAPAPSSGSGAPALSALKLTPRTFAVGKGARLTYKMSSAAKVVFRVRRLSTGVRAGKRCVARSRKHPGGRRCTRTVLLKGSVTHPSVAGTNAFKWNGRIGGHALSPGRYRLAATPAGGRGISVAFRVVKPKRRR